MQITYAPSSTIDLAAYLRSIANDHSARAANTDNPKSADCAYVRGYADGLRAAADILKQTRFEPPITHDIYGEPK